MPIELQERQIIMCSYSSFPPSSIPPTLLHPAGWGSQMNDLAKQLGRRIHLFRKQSRLTQAALAEKARISNEFMSGIERGAKLPSLPTLYKLAGVLRVNLKDLFNFDQAGYRRTQSLSRDSMDVAFLLDNVSSQQRRRILRVVKILIEATDE
jgi:transcriptional regulator with XRE-family HTH domain